MGSLNWVTGMGEESGQRGTGLWFQKKRGRCAGGRNESSRCRGQWEGREAATAKPSGIEGELQVNGEGSVEMDYLRRAEIFSLPQLTALPVLGCWTIS